MASYQNRIEGDRKRKNFPLSLDPEIMKAIQELANEDGRSRSGYVELVLRKHIQNIENTAS